MGEDDARGGDGCVVGAVCREHSAQERVGGGGVVGGDDGGAADGAGLFPIGPGRAALGFEAGDVGQQSSGLGGQREACEQRGEAAVLAGVVQVQRVDQQIGGGAECG